MLLSFFVKKFRIALIILSILFLGICLSKYKWNKINNITFSQKPLICNGEVISSSDIKDGKSIIININSCSKHIEEKPTSLNIKAKLFCAKPCANLIDGNKIRFRAKLKKPTNFNNPGYFPYKEWLASKGIGATGTITKNWIANIDNEQSFFAKIRRKISKDIDSTDKAKGF